MNRPDNYFSINKFEIMKRYLILSALCGLLINAAFAQKVTVLDRSDLRPVSQVSITNKAKNIMVVTGADGTADISAFSGPDSLYFSHVAYQNFATTLYGIGEMSNIVYLTENVIKLDEFVISANKVEEKRSDLPYTIEVIQAKEIEFSNPQTSAIMLEQTGNVFVQQSQLGGGSPVMRGF